MEVLWPQYLLERHCEQLHTASSSRYVHTTEVPTSIQHQQDMSNPSGNGTATNSSAAPPGSTNIVTTAIDIWLPEGRYRIDAQLQHVRSVASNATQVPRAMNARGSWSIVGRQGLSPGLYRLVQLPIRRVITDEGLPEDDPLLYAPMPQATTATPSLAPLSTLTDPSHTADSASPPQTQGADVPNDTLGHLGEGATERRPSSSSHEASEVSEHRSQTASASFTEHDDDGYAEDASTASGPASGLIGELQAADNVSPTRRAANGDHQLPWADRLRPRTTRGWGHSDTCSRDISES